MKVFSLFSGIGGFDLALERCGHKIVGHSEIDEYADKIYSKHFTNKNYGDIKRIRTDELPDFDMLCGGFPCQAFSIAGKRLGFSDTRGTLFFEIARIAKHKRPKLLLLENVKGLLSHDNQRTFETILCALSELGYDLQWQVLNSKNFGVPQNRERVFIVGHLRGECRPEVFPIKECSTTNIQEITQNVSDAQRIYTTNCAKTLKGLGGGQGAKTGLYAIPCTSKKDLGRKFVETDVFGTLTSTYYKGVKGDGRPAVAVRVEEATKKGYAEASEGDSINLSVPGSKTRRGRVGKKIAQTLDTGMQQYTLQALTEKRTDEAKAIRKKNMKKGKDWSPRRGKKLEPRNDGLSNCLTSSLGKEHFLSDGYIIRRLTPKECERLQGFPDEWTTQGIQSGELVSISDTQRYKCLGNAVTVNVIEAIVKKLNFL